MHRSIRRAPLLAVAVTALAPGLADAHVSLQPAQVPAGSFSRVDVRVPNERDDASTTKVAVKFPPGFLSASYQQVPGWTAETKMARLAKPVVADGEKHSEQVDTVTFATRGKGIGPGQFQDFGLSLAMPSKVGSTLTFKAVQTYSDGQVARWIAGADADEPAPHVTLTAAVPEGGTATAPASKRARATPAATRGGGASGGALSIA